MSKISNYKYKIKAYIRLLLKLPRQLMQIDLFRNVFCFIRHLFLSRRLKILETANGNPNIYKETIRFNLLGAKDLSGERTHQLIRPLVSIERILRTQNQQKILSIGPRTESEIFNLWAYGFSLKNITGLDLFTYSKYIKIGDMHSMDFEDSKFDIVIAGWVLVYSNTPEVAAAEIVRVAKNGAILAITASYNNRLKEEVIQRHGSIDAKRFDTLHAIKDAFKDHIDFIYFQQDVDSLFVNDIASPILIFKSKK